MVENVRNCVYNFRCRPKQCCCPFGWRNGCLERRKSQPGSLRASLRTLPSRRWANSLPRSKREESPPSSAPCLRSPAAGIPELHARLKLLRSLFIPELANNLKELVLRAIAVGKLCGGALDSPLPLDRHQLLRLSSPPARFFGQPWALLASRFVVCYGLNRTEARRREDRGEHNNSAKTQA